MPAHGIGVACVHVFMFVCVCVCMAQVHSSVRQRWQDGDREVHDAMRELAEIARQGRWATHTHTHTHGHAQAQAHTLTPQELSMPDIHMTARIWSCLPVQGGAAAR